MNGENPPDYLEIPRADGAPGWRIARRLREARGAGRDRPGLVWLGGFASDMRGAKASFVDAYAACARPRFVALRLFRAWRVGLRYARWALRGWRDRRLVGAEPRVIRSLDRGPQILIGTSMGAWIALLLARRLNEIRLRDRLRALLLLAPAVDFTEELLWKTLPAAARRLIAEKGVYARPSPYGPMPTPITRRLVEDGRAHLLLGGPVRAHAPTHIIQGVSRRGRALASRAGPRGSFGGRPGDDFPRLRRDDRLSRPQDLERLVTTLDALG